MNNNLALIEALQQIGNDIHVIRILMGRLARESFTNDLEAIATSPERKEIWRLADGSRSTEVIAKRIGVSRRTVQYFLQEAQDRELIFFAKRGFPKRPDYFDEVPYSWKRFKSQNFSEADKDSTNEGQTYE